MAAVTKEQLEQLAQLFSVLEVDPTRAGAWSGDPLWGVSKNNWPAAQVTAGVQLPNPVGLGEFIGYGPPRLYEVRFGVDWGNDVIAGPFDEGFLQAEVVSGIGCARQVCRVDVANGSSIIVPGGTISVTLHQVGLWGRILQSVSASIASMASHRPLSPTCSVIPVESATVGPPVQQVSNTRIPSRAVALRVRGDFSTGLYTVTFATAGGTIAPVYDSGADRYLLQTGIPIPANCLLVNLLRPNTGTGKPVLEFVLD